MDAARSIVVTVPRREYAVSDREDIELRQGGCAFWSMKRRPAHITPGMSRLYFYMSGKIDSSMRITGVSQGPKRCEMTGRVWPGPVILHLDDFRDEDIVFPGSGFRGFRYLISYLEGK